MKKSKYREDLELQLGEQLNYLISSSHALNVRAAECFDSSLQPAAFIIVRWLFSYGAANATILADATAMDKSSISRLINQLKKFNYVKSEADPNDKRGVIISLTELGKTKTIEALKQKETAFYERILNWDDTKLENFVALFREFNLITGLE
ncbi:MarR family winged helix-turn-helix transcriptional regulator [Clostridium intestinale]|jgi:DNA-binding MarR family transcriptional regulator|uniref:MarR family transcriptional regulator n=1 Tax=Clostridium intestinale TaxID=36845 RepID=A0A7D6VXF4_9CLOT|nr:MarR family transcriptional regulator [Clostridium intestinale]QLY77951.1 MarR family transcriptional regulator [Clostridium intestinale]